MAAGFLFLSKKVPLSKLFLFTSINYEIAYHRTHTHYTHHRRIFLALVTGLIAMVVRKKGGNHNRTGIVFYWSSFVVLAAMAFVLDPLSLKYQFFLTIGIVSFYPAVG
jgi:hypothetical protein